MNNNRIPTALADQAEIDVDGAAAANGIVNVSVLAERLRLRNLQDNVALEDIECHILRLATRRGAIVVFDRGSASSNVFGQREDDGQIDFV